MRYRQHGGVKAREQPTVCKVHSVNKYLQEISVLGAELSAECALLNEIVKKVIVKAQRNSYEQQLEVI